MFVIALVPPAQRQALIMAAEIAMTANVGLSTWRHHLIARHSV